MILVFTGAGISKASGIDTFMEHPDVRDKLHRSYAQSQPKSYNETIRALLDVIQKAEPNAAHKAIAKAGYPVITMNIDGLHERAGSKDVIAVHGTMPTDEEVEYADTLRNKPVLYGDIAPEYERAMERVFALEPGDIFLVVGASRYTQIAVQLREIAKMQGAKVIEIQHDANNEVPRILKTLKH